METREELLSFYDYNVGDIVEYGGQQYAVTDIKINPTDPTGFMGHAGLSIIKEDGTYEPSAEMFIEAPTQVKRVQVVTSDNTTSPSSNVGTNQEFVAGNDTILNQAIDPNATVMNFSQISATVNDWSSFTRAFSASVPRAKEHQGFIKLIDVGLDNGFVASFENNINNLIAAMNQAIATTNANVDNMANEDDKVQRDGESSVGGGRPKRTEASGGSFASGGSGQNELVNNAKEQLEQYKKMSMNDLSGIASELNKLGIGIGKTVDELLTDVNYSSKIQEMMLKKQNLTPELREMIKVGEVSISQKILASIFNGNNLSIAGLNQNTIIAIKKYLTTVAKDNNLDLNSLLNNQENAYTLKNSLKNFGSITSIVSSTEGRSVKDEILQIYDGNAIDNIDSSCVSVIRDYIDQVATTQNTTAETLLTGTTDINNEIQNLGKAAVFTNSLANYNSTAASTILNSLFNK